MTTDALKIIKDELASAEQMLYHKCFLYDEFKEEHFERVMKITEALSVAVETLQTMNHLEVQFKAQGGVYNPKLGCVKHETIWDVTTKPSEDALKTIANILSGGKDGK